MNNKEDWEINFENIITEGSSFYRAPKSKQEKAKAAGSEVDEMEPKARAKRNAKNLPDSRDDLNQGRTRSWKKHRKTQYKVKEGNFPFLNYLKESYELYHDSYTSAVQTAKNIAIISGYTIDEDEAMNVIGLGSKKPDVNDTVSLHLNLYDRDGNPVKQRLHFQVYNRGTEKKPYELNAYIS